MYYLDKLWISVVKTQSTRTSRLRCLNQLKYSPKDNKIKIMPNHSNSSHRLNINAMPVKNRMTCQGTAKNVDRMSRLFSLLISISLFSEILCLTGPQKPNGRVRL